MILSPCKDCPRRHLACWDVCPDYQRFIAECHRISKARQEEAKIAATVSYVGHSGTGIKKYMDLKKRGRL